MSQVITFENVTPTARYDGIPWTDVIIQEALTSDAAEADWTTIDQVALSPVDADPENPATRDFTTEGASDEPDLWYRLVFVDADGDELLPTVPIQNLTDTVSVYATVTELARILKIRVTSDEQRDAMDRVLLVASGEIDAEIDLAADASLTSWQLALAQEVCLERAVEHWRQQESPFGLIGLGAELPAERTARDSWERHAHKLAPLKGQWGLA
jgi:hypothetical protein